MWWRARRPGRSGRVSGPGSSRSRAWLPRQPMRRRGNHRRRSLGHAPAPESNRSEPARTDQAASTSVPPGTEGIRGAARPGSPAASGEAPGALWPPGSAGRRKAGSNCGRGCVSTRREAAVAGRVPSGPRPGRVQRDASAPPPRGASCERRKEGAVWGRRAGLLGHRDRLLGVDTGCRHRGGSAVWLPVPAGCGRPTVVPAVRRTRAASGAADPAPPERAPSRYLGIRGRGCPVRRRRPRQIPADVRRDQQRHPRACPPAAGQGTGQ